MQIQNLAGKVTVEGWNRGEVQVTGTLGDDVEGLEFTVDGCQSVVRVKIPHRSSGSNRMRSEIVVLVPAKSEVEVNCVSAAVEVRKLKGRLESQTVSGDVTVVVDSPELSIQTVSGNVDVKAKDADVRLQLVSGEAEIEMAQGVAEVQTVSGSICARVGKIRRRRFNTLSGKLQYTGGLQKEGELTANSFSGSVVLTLSGLPEADFRLSTKSGRIRKGFGPEAEVKKGFMNKTLQFTTGSGKAKVRVETFSGSISVEKGEG